MTFTKRQFFIYRIDQCIKLFSKIQIYMLDIYVYVLKTKYRKEIDKLTRNINKCLKKLNEFHTKVKYLKVAD